jgi:hypothetical protein
MCGVVVLLPASLFSGTDNPSGWLVVLCVVCSSSAAIHSFIHSFVMTDKTVLFCFCECAFPCLLCNVVPTIHPHIRPFFGRLVGWLTDYSGERWLVACVEDEHIKPLDPDDRGPKWLHLSRQTRKLIKAHQAQKKGYFYKKFTGCLDGAMGLARKYYIKLKRAADRKAAALDLV